MTTLGMRIQSVGMLVMFVTLSLPARAATVGITRPKLLGIADFGAGTHVGGGPVDPGSVHWDYEPTGKPATVSVTARVQGILCYDRFGSGCARLQTFFQDKDGNNLVPVRIDLFCGPGGNANDAVNKRAIDRSFTHAALRKVVLVTGFADTESSLFNDEDAESSLNPKIDVED